ncbi:MAG: DUF2911 domain-containing protein [Saprospiraceae bacterium]|nr:DUF2911 domain-containing protein [Saprospiraceae bacterium]
MKQFVTTLFVAVFTLVLGQNAQAQDFPKVDKSVLDVAYYPARAAFRNFEKTPEAKAANEPIMRVIYSRPLKNGRKVFGELEKFGTVWRVGANEATEIQFFKPVRLNGTAIQAGRYTLYAELAEKEWTVHVSTDLDGWGAYSFKPEASTVAKITVPTAATKSVVEACSILFEKAEDGAHLIIAWDDTMVRVPFQF